MRSLATLRRSVPVRYHPVQGVGMDWTELSTADLVARLRSGELASAVLTIACLDAIEQRDPAVQAFLQVDRASALAQAEAIDARRQRGETLGLLAGLPIGIKDVIC